MATQLLKQLTLSSVNHDTLITNQGKILEQHVENHNILSQDFKSNVTFQNGVNEQLMGHTDNLNKRLSCAELDQVDIIATQHNLVATQHDHSLKLAEIEHDHSSKLAQMQAELDSVKSQALLASFVENDHDLGSNGGK